VRSMIDGGYLEELSKLSASQLFEFGGRCYRVAQWLSED
jgi:hypothetical protein